MSCSCCLNCKNRKELCHKTCYKYQEFKKNLETVHKNKSKYSEFYAYVKNKRR